MTATLGIVLAVVANPTTGSCSGGSPWGSECSVSNSGSHIDISGSQTTPGSTPDRPGGSRPTTPQQPAPAEPCPLNRCEIDYTVAGLPDVTLADLASFRPAAPTLAGEPAGFGVVGMPTNLVASASEQRIAGALLGYDVTVRFVPVGFVFDHGDGTSQRSTTGGASWTRLGQAQFTPTATSHAYAARGTYPARVTVQYAASVDFGSGNWRPVAGYVTATTGGYDVQVVDVRTALVDKTCAENPSGPGC